MNRLEATVKEKGFAVIARVDHAAGKVMLSYNDPKFLAERHKAAGCSVVGGMTNALDGLMKSVVAP